MNKIKRTDPDWLQETKHKGVVLTVPGMDQVKVRENLTYHNDSDRDLLADVYTPHDSTEDDLRPGVVFVHGGYLPPNLMTKPKDWGVFTSYGRLMAASGLAAVTFNHRYYGQDDLETAREDIQKLIEYVRAGSPEFGIDPSQLHLWVFSGGGPLISWILQEAPSYLRSLFLYYTILDTRSKSADKADLDARQLAFSPAHQLQITEKELFPIFIARAGLDRPTLNQTIDDFIEIALKKNIQIEICNHPQGQHGFDLLDDIEKSRQIIHRSIEFIKSIQL